MSVIFVRAAGKMRQKLEWVTKRRVIENGAKQRAGQEEN